MLFRNGHLAFGAILTILASRTVCSPIYAAVSQFRVANSSSDIKAPATLSFLQKPSSTDAVNIPLDIFSPVFYLTTVDTPTTPTGGVITGTGLDHSEATGREFLLSFAQGGIRGSISNPTRTVLETAADGLVITETIRKTVTVDDITAGHANVTLSSVSPSFSIATIVETAVDTIVITETVRPTITVAEVAADHAYATSLMASPNLSNATIVETALDTLVVTETVRVIITVTEIVVDDADIPLSLVSPSFDPATIVETAIESFVITETIRPTITVAEVAAEQSNTTLSPLLPSFVTIVETAIESFIVIETVRPTVTIGIATDHAGTASTSVLPSFESLQATPEVMTVRHTTLITKTIRPTVTVFEVAGDEAEVLLTSVSVIFVSTQVLVSRPTTVVTTTIRPTITVIEVAGDQSDTLSTTGYAIVSSSWATQSAATLRPNIIVAMGNDTSLTSNSSTMAAPTDFIVSGYDTSAKYTYIPVTVSENGTSSTFTGELGSIQTSSNTSATFSTSSSFTRELGSIQTNSNASATFSTSNSFTRKLGPMQTSSNTSATLSTSSSFTRELGSIQTSSNTSATFITSTPEPTRDPEMIADMDDDVDDKDDYRMICEDDSKDKNNSCLDTHGDPHDTKSGNIAGEAIGGALAFYWLIRGAMETPAWAKLIPKPFPSGENVPINWLRGLLGKAPLPKLQNWSYKFPTLTEGGVRGFGGLDPKFPEFHRNARFDVSKLNEWVNRFPKGQDWKQHLKDFQTSLKNGVESGVNYFNKPLFSESEIGSSEWNNIDEGDPEHNTPDDHNPDSHSETPDPEDREPDVDEIPDSEFEDWEHVRRGGFGGELRPPAWPKGPTSAPPASGPPQVDNPSGEPTDELNHEPTDELNHEPTDELNHEPTDELNHEPTDELNHEPTDELNHEPTDELNHEPTDEPSNESIDGSGTDSDPFTKSMMDLLREMANDPFGIERGVDMGSGEDPFPAAELLRHLDLESLVQPVDPDPNIEAVARILAKYENKFNGPYPPAHPGQRNIVYTIFKGMKNWLEKWTDKLNSIDPFGCRDVWGERPESPPYTYKGPYHDVVRRVVGKDPGHNVSLAQLVRFVDGAESHRSFGGLFDGAIEELGWAMEVTGTQSVIDRVMGELPQGIREIILGLKSAIANLQPASDSVHAALSSGLDLLSLSIMNSKVAPPTIGQHDEAADRDVPILKYAHETIRLHTRLIAMRASFAEFATMVDNIGVNDAWRAQVRRLQNGLKSTLSWFDRLTGWMEHEVRIMTRLLESFPPSSPPPSPPSYPPSSSSPPSSPATSSPPAPSVPSPVIPPGAPFGQCRSRRDDSGTQHIHFSLSVEWQELKQAADSCGILDGTWQNHKVTANGKTDSVAVFDLPAIIRDTCPDSIRACLDLAPHPTTTAIPSGTMPDRHSVYWLPTDAAGLAAYPTASPHAECNYWVTPQKGLAAPPVTYEIFHMSNWRDMHDDPVRMLNALKRGVLSFAALDVADWRMGNDSQTNTPFAYFQWHNVYSLSGPSRMERIVRDIGGQADMKCVRREDKSFGDLKVSHVPFSDNDGVVGNAWEGYIGDVPIGRDGYGGLYRV